MAEKWHTTEAFERDLWSFSEMEGTREQDDDISTPATILEYNARIGVNNNPSIFDNPCPTDDVTYIVSGRGRGGVSTIIRPGIAPRPDPTVQDDVKRRLRQVSGMGYSNELIERSFKTATGIITGVKNPEIKLEPKPTISSTASSGSTPSFKLKVQSTSSSKTSSPNITPSKCTPSNSSMSSCSSRTSTPSYESEPAHMVEKACVYPAHPPPLSVMRNQAKRVMKKTKEKSSDEAKENKPELKVNGETNLSDNTNLNIDAPEWYPNGNRLGNDYWWNQRTETSSEDSNSWRRRDSISPNRYFNAYKPLKKTFNIGSSKEFPALK